MRARNLLAFALVLGGVSCGSGITKLHFDIDKSIPTQTINGSLAPCSIAGALPFLGSPFQATFSQAADFPQQKTDVAHITSAKVSRISLTLTATSPTANWDFLDDLTINVQDQSQTLPKVVVASIGVDSDSHKAITAGSTTLDLVTTGVQLASYVKAPGGFTMTADAVGCPPQQDADFDGSVRVSVVADPL